MAAGGHQTESSREKALGENVICEAPGKKNVFYIYNTNLQVRSSALAVTSCNREKLPSLKFSCPSSAHSAPGL